MLWGSSEQLREEAVDSWEGTHSATLEIGFKHLENNFKLACVLLLSLFLFSDKIFFFFKHTFVIPNSVQATKCRRGRDGKAERSMEEERSRECGEEAGRETYCNLYASRVRCKERGRMNIGQRQEHCRVSQ